MKSNLPFASVALCVLWSCNSTPKKGLPKTNSFFLFRHVKEIVDSNSNVTTNFQLLDTPLTTQEKDTLAVILKRFGWPYKETVDGELLISEIAMGNYDGLYFLDAELYKRIHK